MRGGTILRSRPAYCVSYSTLVLDLVILMYVGAGALALWLSSLRQPAALLFPIPQKVIPGQTQLLQYLASPRFRLSSLALIQLVAPRTLPSRETGTGRFSFLSWTMPGWESQSAACLALLPRPLGAMDLCLG